MEKKKSAKVNLETKRVFFLEIGFVLVLAMVFYAFEYKSYESVEYSIYTSSTDYTPEDMIPPTIQKPKVLPLIPPPPTHIEIVEKTDEVLKDLVIDVSIGLDDPIDPWIPIEDPPEIVEPEIYISVQEMPEFPGGVAAMYKFISNTIDYPRLAKEMNISGRVFLTFVVERDGKVADVKVLRGIGHGCDEEAIRVIEAMPNWSPGKQREVPVRVQYQMAIKFSLQ